MDKFLPIMTDEYRRKNYRKGVFASIRKKSAFSWFLTYVFFGAVLGGGAYGVYWALQKVQEYRLNGQEDMTGIGYGIAAVAGVFALIGLLCIVITIVRNARSAEQWKARCAKANGYSIEDVNVFEHQALEDESRVITLLDIVNRTASGQRDGILTRDYIYPELGKDGLLKYSDIAAACLLKQTAKMSSGSVRGAVDFLVLGIIGKNGSSSIVECSKESGPVLQAFLTGKNPEIYTADGEVLDGDEYQDLWAKIAKK